MKKLIIVLVAVLVLFGGFMALNQKNMPAAATPATPAPVAVTPDATPTPPEVKGLDYAAIRALHGADETAITLGDETLDWGFFADFLRTNGVQYERLRRRRQRPDLCPGPADRYPRDPGKLHGYSHLCQGAGRKPG